MQSPLLAPEIRELIAAGDAQSLRNFCSSNHPVEAAEAVGALEPGEAWAVLGHADPELRAEIFSHLDNDFQAEVIGTLRRGEICRLLADMPPDDRADLFNLLPEDRREAILPGLAQAEREDIRRLSAYVEGTAGAVMTSDYAALSPDLTVSRAIERLREIAPDKETIYYSYVVDEKRNLLGFVSLKDLILAPREARIREVMNPDVVFARANEDQEEVVRKIQKYDLLALPVINGGDALVGIITHDDALDIIHQEHTEDLEKLMAIAGRHQSAAYLKTTAWEHFKNRVLWVVALAVLGLASGFIVQNFEGLLLQFAILAVFMPMLVDTGGNTGSQAATLVVRALAVDEIRPSDFLRVFLKELQVALMLALILAGLAFARVQFFGGGTIPPEFTRHGIALAISVALGLQVVSATLIGAFLPLGAAGLKLDPAVVASPALTTTVDITGLLIYFFTVKIMLGL